MASFDIFSQGYSVSKTLYMCYTSIIHGRQHNYQHQESDPKGIAILQKIQT